MASGGDDKFVGRYGPWAVVTGASDGIGQAFARHLAAKGLNLALVARRGERLAALERELAQAHGVTCLPVALDLSLADAPQALAETMSGYDVGLLVAAAGYGTSGPFLDGDIGQELEMIDVNCRAVAALTHLFGKRLAARGKGGIILLSSLVAFQGVPRAANYAATKAYVQVLAEGLRQELSRMGIDVAAIAPGPVRSGFGARAGMTMGMAGTPDVVAAASLSKLGRKGTIRPGFVSTLLESALAPLPRRGRTMILQRVMAGMTSHQQGAK